MPKRSRKCLSGRPQKKSPQSPGNSPGSLQRVSGKCLESVFEVFQDCLETTCGPAAGGPGIHFRDLFGISGRRAGWFPILDVDLWHFSPPQYYPLPWSQAEEPRPQYIMHRGRTRVVVREYPMACKLISEFLMPKVRDLKYSQIQSGAGSRGGGGVTNGGVSCFGLVRLDLSFLSDLGLSRSVRGFLRFTLFLFSLCLKIRWPRASSILYRIIRVEISVFSLFGLTKSCSCANLQTQPPLPFIQRPWRKQRNCDTIRHYFAFLHLKICYCSWPPNKKRTSKATFPKGCGTQWGHFPRIASAVAIYRMGNRSGAKNTGKMGKKMENGPRPEMAEKWPPKWKNEMGFGPFFLYFSISAAIFRPFQAGGHFPFSFPFSPDFCAGPVSHSVDGHRRRNPRKKNQRPPGLPDLLTQVSNSKNGSQEALAEPAPECQTTPSQRALRDRLMSRGKNCLPTVSRQFLTRNYPRPNCLLKCLPNCLSPTEGFFFLFQN